MRVHITLLATLLLAGCGRGPQPTEEEIRPPEKTAHVAVGTEKTELRLRDTKGQAVWRVTGTLRSTLIGKELTGAILDAEAHSELPGYDVMAKAGRIVYQLGEPTVRFDRRLYVGSPTRAASLEAEAATFGLEDKVFRVAGPGRARYGSTTLEAEQAEAELDLRRLTATTVIASGAGDQASWRARAARGEVDEQRRVRLEEVTGVLTENGGATAFEAPLAVWKPELEWLNCNDGATLHREGLRVRAEGVTWRRREGLVVARGSTRFERQDLLVTGSGGRIKLADRTAELSQVRASLTGVRLAAARGQVAANRVITLTGATVTLTEDGTVLTAGRAVYDPGQRRLTATAGGTARRGTAALTAGHAVWSAAGGRFEAGGGVRLSDGGMTVTGDRLSAPSDLSSATLRPVRASGTTGGRRWELRAERGHYTPRQTTLTNARGTFRDGDRNLTASSPRVIHDPAAGKIRFLDGFRAASQDGSVQVRSDRATYDLAKGAFLAEGNVNAQARGVAVKNQSWTYYFGRRAGAIADSGPPPARRKEEAGGSAAKGEPGDKGAENGATGTGDRQRDGGDQGPEVPRPDAPGAGPAGRTAPTGG